jgi:3-deoxy-manno-octulosonate cytidylyltransferase (CMP-KDO synthetase)
MKIACVIPARLQSTRFPRKVLSLLHGQPLIQWVWKAACQVPFFHSVTLAIDSLETAAVVESFGGNYVMTPQECPSGTMRLAQLVADNKLSGDIFVNWQGDEPFIHTDMISTLLQSVNTEESDLWTLKKELTHDRDIDSPHIVKVVTDGNGFALYFSRSRIPYHRDHQQLLPYFKHIGLYAYTRTSLQRIVNLPTSSLAEAEQLEQLNFLYHGFKIRVHETTDDSLGIDIPEHLEKAHNL